MPVSYRVLRVSDLLFKRRGSAAYRLSVGVFDIALKLFFRRIETANESAVPPSGGLIFVLNHPNGLIDPALVFVALPRRISFLAKSTLFRMPVISFLLRTVDALPLYRRIDAGEDIAKNQLTFEACRELLKRGGSIALFPEGVSHNSPKLLPLKTGAARIALGAASVGGTDLEIKIVPVGLYYTSKTTFRSEAMLHFGEPFAVPRVELDTDGQPRREDVHALTRQIESELRRVTLNAETDAEINTAGLAERIFAAGADDENLAERFTFLKSYVERTNDGGASEKDLKLRSRVIEFQGKLARLGLGPVHLSLARFSRWFVVRQAFLQTWYLLFLLPFAVVGAILHFPAYQICKVLSRIYARHGADDVASTVKVLAAMLFMPLTWLITAGVVYYYFGWQAAALSVPASFILGWTALYTLEEAEELRGWAIAIIHFLFRRDMFLRLFAERNSLRKALEDID